MDHRISHLEVNDNRALGYLKASPDGTLIAAALGDLNTIDLFDFDDMTGEISNFRSVGSGFSQPYGIEFSPDGSKMYATSLALNQKVQQIDLANGNATFDLPFTAGTNRYCGALQISPHGIIYLATGTVNQGMSSLPAILNPDEAGVACNIVDDYQNLGTGRVHYGLPTFIQSFFLSPSFQAENTCFTNATEFSLEIELQEGQEIDSVIWHFGDPASGADSIFYANTDPFDATHVFTGIGSFNVKVTLVLVGGFTFSTNQSITINPRPIFDIANIGGDVQDTFAICFGETLKFRIQPWGFTNAAWSNGSTGQVSSNYNSSGLVFANVTNTQGCSSVYDTAYLEVGEELNFTFTVPDFCEGDDPIIINDSVNIKGGEYSGAAITFDGTNYILDPALIPLGGSTITTYNYEDAAGCTGSNTFETFLFPKPTVSLMLTTTEACEDADAFVLNGGLPLGGSYLGSGVVAGSFDPGIANIGNNEIKYGYENTDGCSDTATANILVNALPTVTFDPVPALCQNTGIVTIDQGQPTGGGGFGAYSGSPNIDAAGNFNTNTAAGQYNLVYEYTDDNGCADTAQQSVEVILEPQAPTAISVDNNAFCTAQAPTTISLECIGPDANYFWYENDFSGLSLGNTKTLTIAAPAITTTYLARSETSCGNSDALSVTVTVNPSPTAAFSAADVCEDVAVSFLDESLSPLEPITSWNWDFGDGNTSTEESPTHTYSGFGNRDIQLIVKTDALCADTATQSISITRAPQPPTAISVNTDEYCISLTPEDITLECVGLDEDYYWYENDFTGTSIGTTKTLTLAAPAATTTYLARSQTSCGNSDALSVTVTVLPNPTAAFNAADVCDGNNVAFNDVSFDDNDVITNWNWNFGDGNTSTDPNPSYLFSSYGTQDIELVVTNASGCVDTLQQSVEVFDNPAAAFNFTTECLGDASSFTNTSAAPASTIDSWTWDIEGSAYNTENTSHTFSGSGDFVVSLTVETEEGCSNSTSQSVNVYPLPVANFTFFNPCRSNVVELTNSSTSAPVDGSSPIASYLWDFNNGETSDTTNASFKYIYPGAGVYSINLTVTDGNGCSDVFTANNVIVSPDFDVSISADPFCIGVEGIFDGEPVPDFLPMDSYEWLLPDGSSVIGEDIPYTFDAAGTYEVGLVGTLDVCTAGKTYTVEVKELPQAGFDFSGQCLQSPVQFNDTSILDGLAILSWSWDFGDGFTSNLENPQHTYAAAGTFPVALEVTDANNCVSSFTYDVVQRELPEALFNEETALCEDEIIELSNQSTTPGSFTAYEWFMGDGQAYSSQDVQHTYTANGDFTVKLIVTDNWACQDSIEQVLSVTPDFSLNILESGLCKEREDELIAEVLGNPVIPDAFNWTFYDGSTAIGESTFFTFLNNGDFNVALNATKNGCVEYHTQTVPVHDLPEAYL